MIHLYKYNKKFYMGLMVIIENKIKLVTGVWGENLNVLHIPPKCLCTKILDENWTYHKITKTKYEIKIQNHKL